MSTLPEQQAPVAAKMSIGDITKKFISIGITKEAFLKGSLVPGDLEAYLSFVAPYEQYTDAEQIIWNRAFQHYKKMMNSLDQQKSPTPTPTIPVVVL